MKRAFNFSPGPSMLPLEVLQQAQQEMLDWCGTGMSAMEVSHRGKAFNDVVLQSEALLRELLSIPDDYHVLFLPGGACCQFTAIPMNLRHLGPQADYVLTGQWGEKAMHEAKRFMDVSIPADTSDVFRIPKNSELNFNKNASYVHFTPNETIVGVEFHDIPDTNGVPLVGDFTSSILSRPLDVSKYGVVYAGSQKNLGAAGLTVVIVQKDLLGDRDAGVPMVFDWKSQLENQSCLNTPITYTWYLANLCLKWLKGKGGVKAMGQINKAKSDKLYAYIDSSSFYNNPVETASRSWMNVPFTLADDSLDEQFLTQAEANGLANLRGHRVIGGMRASIYNAMPMAGIDALIAFMTEFERKQ